MVVYHGSCHEFENIDLSKSHNRRDFGKGFYTTILQSQSKEWLEFIKENRNKGGLSHEYDVVIGPVADDNTMETV